MSNMPELTPEQIESFKKAKANPSKGFAQPRSPQSSQSSAPNRTVTRSTVHDETAAESGGALTGAIDSTRSITQRNLESVRDALINVREDREVTIDQASDAIAYLHDPQMLMAEILERAAQKIEVRSEVETANPFAGTYQPLDLESLGIRKPTFEASKRLAAREANRPMLKSAAAE